MSKNNYDLLIFIGRFSPFHLGHKNVVLKALEQTTQLLILLGSSFQARNIKNPFTFQERYDMIMGSLDPQDISKITIRPLRDHLYNENTWINEVQNHVKPFVDKLKSFNTPHIKIGIIGHEKDASSYYLKLFPQWDFIDVNMEYNYKIDSSKIREFWLTEQSPNYTSAVLPDYVQEFIYNKFPKTEFGRLIREFNHIQNYKKQWDNTPYPVQFNTVDNIVIQSGHILLVTRKAAPGEGLYALPGGFVNQHETIENAAIRELLEETKIKASEFMIKGGIKLRRVYDAPNRSLRGRTITHAFLIELPSGKLNKCKGSDDAASARWVSFAELEKMEDQFFEDHYYIIQNMLGNI